MGNIHDGHRARVRERLAQGGLDAFSPHEIIEWLLYCPIPLRDVNELAHALHKRFGSVRAVIEAKREELLQVEGVGARTADFFEALRECVEEYEQYEPKVGRNLSTLKRTFAYARTLLRKAKEDADYLLCVGLNDSLISAVRVNPLRAESNTLVEMVETTLHHRAYGVVVLRYSASGELVFTEEDMRLAKYFLDYMDALSVHPLDYLRLNAEAGISMRNVGILRRETLNEGDERTVDWLK